MSKIILPTSELVKTYSNFEELFEFYNGGIRNIIRDMVFLNDGCYRLSNSSSRQYGYHRPIINGSAIARIMHEYSNSSEAVIRRILENTSIDSYVESAAREIEESVNIMMSIMFVEAVYVISKHNYKWLGNDLIAEVTLLN